MTRPELYQSIADLKVDSGNPAFTFVDRLARENGWSAAYANRVLVEYLKFVYLACVGQRPVTPSIAVDQAWHLHLCYTRSYWNDLCEKRLGRPLHHGPTQGGPVEESRYREQYHQTLELYRIEFACSPPPDIWPAAGERFDPANNPVWVTHAKHWIVDKRKVTDVSLRVAVGITALFCTGAMVAEADGTAWLILGVIVGAVLLVWLLLKKAGKGEERGKDGGSGCGAGCSGAGHSGCGSDSGHSGCGGNSGCSGGSGCGAGGGCGGGGD